MRLGILLAVFVVGSVSLVAIPHAEAHNTYVSIIRSETCKITQCVTVADLIKHDNSTQAVSGKFVLAGDDYIRAKSPLKNSIMYYSMWNNQKIIFVEPDQSTLARSKTITVTNSLPAYLTGPHVKTELNHNTDSWQYRSGAYVDERCQSATVGIAQGGDISGMIGFMLSGCTGDYSERFTTQVVTQKTREYYCGQQCQHEQWMKAAIESAKTNQLRK